MVARPTRARRPRLRAGDGSEREVGGAIEDAVVMDDIGATLHG
jgi:hypothetical protein